MREPKHLNVGLVGFGTVGAGVARILLNEADAIADKAGVRPALKAICDIDTTTDRGVALPDGLLSDDLARVLDDPEIEVIVELVGGTDFARKLVTRALDAGKHVVTANKALLAHYGQELFERAGNAKRSISFEASVCGGIPIIRTVRDGYVGNEITEMMGIVNGTCNYILTRMSREGIEYDACLEDAQAHGYAEADPTLDVSGMDSAHKIAILARLAFARDIDFDRVYVEGISDIEPIDVQFGDEMGYVLKLVAIAKSVNGELDLRVHPAFLPNAHPLCSVNDVFNAVWIRGVDTGDTMHYGRGTGQGPTAAAVVSDIVDAGLGRATINADNFKAFSGGLEQADVRDIAAVETHYYLRFTVADQPGVLSAISGVLARHGISIASAHQPERSPQDAVPVVITTHRASERSMQAALDEIDGLDFTRRNAQRIRIER